MQSGQSPEISEKMSGTVANGVHTVLATFFKIFRDESYDDFKANLKKLSDFTICR